MRFTYCPDCGCKLTARELGDEGLVPWCDQCDRPWFDMFSTCVIVLAVNSEGKVALLKPANRDYQYKTLVSGYMKPGESAEECARREVEEEIGLHLNRLRLVETVWFPRGEMLMIAFIGYTEDRELRLSCEVEEADWFTPEEAIHLVHPKGPGNASNLLVETYLREKSGNRRIDSMCGLNCSTCDYREPCHCGGCVETGGHPFHGQCPVADCCRQNGYVHCGQCPDMPCALLTQYSCDPEHGDNPRGARIEQCRRWAGQNA